jgi:hypothetical protein
LTGGRKPGMSWTGNKPKNRRKRKKKKKKKEKKRKEKKKRRKTRKKKKRKKTKKRRKRKKRKKKKRKKKESVFKYVHEKDTLSGVEKKRDGIKEKGKKETFETFKRSCGCGLDQGHDELL